MITSRAMGAVLAIGVVAWVCDARAEELPLWELAVGGGVLSVPEYRGADRTRTVPFPFIYPLYRGQRLRIDDEGVRGILYESRRIRFDISADANTPVESDDTSVRAGMPDLDPTVQLGPMLQVRLWTNPEARRTLFLNLPARAVFALNSSGIDQVGYTFSPHLTLYQWFRFLGRPWRVGLSGGLEFGSDKLHEFYYQVDPEFATPTRPAYDATGGYGGTRFIATLVSRTDKSWISIFARYDRFDGAVFEDSPLVERSDGLTVGFIYSRFVARSKKTVSGDW